MTTIREAIVEVLDDDATLAALATGGIYQVSTVGREGLTRKMLLGSGVAINPAVYVVWSTDVPYQQDNRLLRGQNLFFYVYFYQDTGYDVCKQMRERVKALLEYQPVQYDDPADEHMHDLFWRGDMVGEIDESLGDASMERSRYQALYTRRV